MEMHLQPLATTCAVSGEPFLEGARVASFLVRSGAALEIIRYDVLEPHVTTFAPDGTVACSWVHSYKPRKPGENADRALKLTAEHLFVALADPTTEPTPENTRLVQFLALMLERKKILRPRGQSTDGARNRYEHAKSKQIFEVAAGDLTPEFFVAVQAQLSVLVGAPKVKPGTNSEPVAVGSAAAAAVAVAAALPVTDESGGAGDGTQPANSNAAPERGESTDTPRACADPAASPMLGDDDNAPAVSSRNGSGGTEAA